MDGPVDVGTSGTGMAQRLHTVMVALIAADIFIRTFEGGRPELHETIDVMRVALATGERLEVDLGVLITFVRKNLNPHLIPD